MQTFCSASIQRPGREHRILNESNQPRIVLAPIFFGNNHAFGLDKIGIENHPIEWLFPVAFGEHGSAQLEILKFETIFSLQQLCFFGHVPFYHFEQNIIFFVSSRCTVRA